MSERQRRRSQKNEKILCFDSKIVEMSKSTMHKLPASSFSLSKSFLRFHSTSQMYNYNSVFDSFDASASTQSGFSWSSSLFMSTFMTRNLFLMFSTSPNLRIFPSLSHTPPLGGTWIWIPRVNYLIENKSGWVWRRQHWVLFENGIRNLLDDAR